VALREYSKVPVVVIGFGLVLAIPSINVVLAASTLVTVPREEGPSIVKVLPVNEVVILAPPAISIVPPELIAVGPPESP
jgi:hypothetical protein